MDFFTSKDYYVYSYAYAKFECLTLDMTFSRQDILTLIRVLSYFKKILMITNVKIC